MDKFGIPPKDNNLSIEIEKNINDSFLYYNETYKRAIYLALISIKEGLHPLLIGEKGCGLTTLSKLIAQYNK